jgi:hypothetical protein
MFGCTVNGGLTATVSGTRGINQTAVRTGVGVVELTLDFPMAPREYSVGGGISEAVADAGFVPTKLLIGNIAKIEVRTYSAGVPADLDFDVMVFPYTSANLA